MKNDESKSDDFYPSDVSLVLTNPSFGIRQEEAWASFQFRVMLHVGEGWADSDYAEIGKMEALKFNRGVAERSHSSLFSAFDEYMTETLECYDVVFDENGNIRKEFQDPYYGVEDDLFEDFHILFRVELDERYKGHGLVAHVTRIYLENFANANDLVYVKAFPLQFEARREPRPLARSFAGSFAACRSRLCKYYERIGFRRIGKTNHFFFVADHFLSGRSAKD